MWRKVAHLVGSVEKKYDDCVRLESVSKRSVVCVSCARIYAKHI